MVADTLVRNDAPRARAVRQLREWIDAGVLAKGEPLPSERGLARQLGVSRPALRWAINVLKAEGLIHDQGVQTRMVAQGGPRREPNSDGDRSLLRHAIVVLAPTLEPRPGQRHGWSSQIVQGAVDAVRDAGLHVVALHPDRLDANELRGFAGSRPLGLVIPEPIPSLAAYGEVFEDIVRAGIKVVVYGAAPELEGYDRVRSDHERGAYLMTRWLIEKGRRRILQTGPPDLDVYWMKGRRRGYERALAEAGLEPLPAVALSARAGPPTGPDQLLADGRFCVGQFVDHLIGLKPIDAIMASSDGMIFPLAAACRLCGRRVHEDVMLVGYDNYFAESPERAFDSTVPLATVDKQNHLMGEELVRVLIERAEGKLPPEPQDRVVPPRLVPVPSNTSAFPETEAN